MRIKATIVSLGAFGLDKELVYITRAGRRDYAQYSNCIFYQFVGKGKRKEFIRTLASSREMLALNGWDEALHVPNGMTNEETPTMLIARSRFSSFAKEYKAEAEKFFQCIRESGATILIDGEKDTISPLLIETVNT